MSTQPAALPCGYVAFLQSIKHAFAPLNRTTYLKRRLTDRGQNTPTFHSGGSAIQKTCTIETPPATAPSGGGVMCELSSPNLTPWLRHIPKEARQAFHAHDQLREAFRAGGAMYLPAICRGRRYCASF